MVTTLYAGLLGVIYVALSLFVIQGRLKHRVSLGDGANEVLTKRIRIHANFIEYVPLAVLVIILAEFEGVAEMLIHGLCATLVVGRLLHVWGVLSKEGTSFGRAAGTMSTLLVILVASILCVKSFFLF